MSMHVLFWVIVPRSLVDSTNLLYLEAGGNIFIRNAVTDIQVCDNSEISDILVVLTFALILLLSKCDFSFQLFP
jgi:hypothetical protein